jgi:hypothetical protein
VILAGVVTRVDTIWDVARVRNLGSGASQEESKDLIKPKIDGLELLLLQFYINVAHSDFK